MDIEPVSRDWGRADYSAVWQAMRRFTDQRETRTTDEIWRVEHPPVFTLGQAGRPEHVLDAGDIPLIETDRGGQVTYHGPGQAILYPLLDLRRRRLGIRGLVTLLEQTVIAWLATHRIHATARTDAPGVYVGDAKIAALGLRVRRGCSYHGVAVNIDMDLTPYQRINPCGHAGMPVTDLARLGVRLSMAEAWQALEDHLRHQLSAH
ncbi:lipoyl(octanoyl) transferase LipB [Spiribacter pallidus]|jgi:lipoyl(octanoyl) transferase|uniref:lipoyl(octanoyl) transferase LipB n=1 Tax=Spiribacter pallidus TaxID=1987936 RepID=UPI0034A0092D